MLSQVPESGTWGTQVRGQAYEIMRSRHQGSDRLKVYQRWVPHVPDFGTWEGTNRRYKITLSETWWGRQSDVRGCRQQFFSAESIAAGTDSVFRAFRACGGMASLKEPEPS